MKEGYTRITEMLWPFSPLKHVNEVVLENAAVRGTRVHAMCESIAKGLGVYDMEPYLEGYVKSFEHWWDEGHEVEFIEKRFYCEERKLTGKMDFILKGPEGSIIVDLKTSANESKTWPIQGNGYAYLARTNGMNISGIKFIKLHKYGKPPKIFGYPLDEEFFLKCYDVYRYFF